MKAKHTLIAICILLLLPLTARGRVVDKVYGSELYADVLSCYDPSYGDTIYIFWHHRDGHDIYVSVCRPPLNKDGLCYSRYEGNIVIPDTVHVGDTYYTIEAIESLNRECEGRHQLDYPEVAKIRMGLFALLYRQHL